MRQAVVVALLAVALCVPATVAGKRSDVHGLPLPRGSRSGDTNLVESRRGFRKTVDFYKRILRRRGLLHQAIPVYRHRGTVVARFLAEDKASRWRALHVFKTGGRTRIFIVPATPLTDRPERGKESNSQN